MPNLPSKLGPKGENQAKKLLKAKGYRYITQNFQTKFGEIDLVFRDHNQLVFVEVKTRDSDRLGRPEEAVTPRKIKKIARVGEYFMLTHPKLPQFARIDVVAIMGYEIKHYQNVSM